jgi:F0F1-type ATP synthase delta subunit
VKKFFKKIDATAQLTRLTQAMQQILATDPEIKEVVWKGPT